ncbi:histidinol-phosphate aminotransferase [Clostridium sp. CAG:411]|jgi:histidinol-phosphate aminotransferase|nr:histidinol-phosphate transaminase [Lachnospiraceae bacterium]CDE42830.1 histidinol-phosphate aminotransferase [Clostridium sp. CAG:411]
MRPWEKYFRKVEPYVPGEQPKFEKMIKLNTNENPYPPSPEVEKVLREVNCDKLKMYPDPTSEVLVKALAERYQVKEEQVFVGVGSDDVLGMAFLTFFGSDKPILFPDITYSFYDVWAELFQIPYERPALDADFRIKKEDYYKENGGVVITNPNAPTSICENLDFLRDILEHNQDVVVIVDEAYIDFGGESALPLLKEYENLLVVQTFSKSRSMAGMRIGYAFGHPALIQAMNDVKYSYNSYTMDYLTLVTGVAALEDEAYFKENCDKIIATRQRTMERLRQLGFSFPDSKTNFLFATHKTVPAKELFEALRKEKIFVRYFDKPRIDNYLRITIGTDEEMDALIHFLENYLNGNTF